MYPWLEPYWVFCHSIRPAACLLKFPSSLPLPSNWHSQSSLDNSNESFKTQAFFFYPRTDPVASFLCSCNSRGIFLYCPLAVQISVQAIPPHPHPTPLRPQDYTKWSADGSISIMWKLIGYVISQVPHKSEFLGVEASHSQSWMLRAGQHCTGP